MHVSVYFEDYDGDGKLEGFGVYHSFVVLVELSPILLMSINDVFLAFNAVYLGYRSGGHLFLYLSVSVLMAGLGLAVFLLRGEVEHLCWTRH